MSIFNAKKSIAETDILSYITDCHSHILPGVDDGVSNMQESLETLNTLERLGIKELWLTPHIMEDYPNETEALKNIYDELKSLYSGNINLNLASENMLDPLFEERLRNNDLLPIGKEKDKILVETSYFSAPFNLYDLFDQIKSSGYKILLAHPERYIYMDSNEYKRLKSLGILFQTNYTSFAGYYGKETQTKALRLLKEGYIDYLGSDIHSIKSFNTGIIKHSIDKKIIPLIQKSFYNKSI